MRIGARVAVDVGSVRVGVAACDTSGVLASPVTVLARDARQGRDIAALRDLVREREAIEVIVGWPRTLSGQDGPAAHAARGFAETLAVAVAPTPVRLVDERMSTVEATRQLRVAGRDSKSARSVVDAQAAAVILESALRIERTTGSPAGMIVEVDGSATSSTP